MSVVVALLLLACAAAARAQAAKYFKPLPRPLHTYYVAAIAEAAVRDGSKVRRFVFCAVIGDCRTRSSAPRGRAGRAVRHL